MKFLPLFIAIITVILTASFISQVKLGKDPNRKFVPSDWFYEQRAFPNDDIPYDKYIKALEQRDQMALSRKDAFASLPWESVGPYNIGGRITALTVDPADTNIIIIGAAAGGVFKSTNGGMSWIPKTDNFPSLSTGAIKMDPNNSNIIYCGTGEANSSTDSYAGFGMLKSTDKGETWFLSGLENSRHIGKIDVHPLNSNIVYAAVAGALYSKGNDRGVYKSTDAGATWQNVLFVNDSTSAIDVDVDPSDTNIVYAAVWERLRSPSFRKAAGPSSAIYKSTDGGATWSRNLTGLPQNDPVVGRISVAVSPSNPNYVYALYKRASAPLGTDNTFYKFFRSTNKGTNWTEMAGGNLAFEFASFGWYFGSIEVDITDHNTVIVGDVDFHKTTDGGNTFQNITNSYSSVTWEIQHPDQHAMWQNPSIPNHYVTGNDGGVFTTINGGVTWNKKFDLPVSQFYAIAVDYLNSEARYGGTQDNGSIRTTTGNQDDWYEILGGDGFHCHVDYTSSNIIYAEYQFGGISRSTNGGASFSSIRSGVDFTRTNWSTPYILDPSEPNILYIGTFRVFRSTNRGTNWSAISPDLTATSWGTLTTLSAGVLAGGVRTIYAGTNDGKVSVSTNGGTNWTTISQGLPQRYVTDVVADKRNPAIAYVTLSGYNRDLANPHVFRTTNFGSTWTDISGNLPDIPVNSLIIDYDYEEVLYIGTDAGVFYTSNLGVSWDVLGTDLPNSPVFDLAFHQPTKILYAGTHGRSMWAYDVTGLVSTKENLTIVNDFELYNIYPNPFNSGNQLPVVSFKLNKDTEVTIELFSMSGELVKSIPGRYLTTGEHKIPFDVSGLSSGVYLYRVSGSGFSSVKKFSLVK